MLCLTFQSCANSPRINKSCIFTLLFATMSQQEDHKHQYTMINNQDWTTKKGETSLNFDNINGTDHNVNNQVYDDQYDITRLDHAWFPLLRKNLQNGNISQRSQDGVPLVRVASEGDDTVDYVPSSDRPLSSVDEIDARGSFSARDLEEDLRQMSRRELENRYGVSWNKVQAIIRRTPKQNGMIEYRAFLETLKNYRLNTEQESRLKGAVRAFAYAEEFTCWPPTLFMILVTALESAIFIYHLIHFPAEHETDITWSGPVPYCSVLIYHPRRRWEIWRYITYMCVHIGMAHFIFNMIMQVLVGVFLEMEQEGWIGSLRVFAVYMAGVLAGSLGTSLSEPNTFVAGASGGVYALIAAHLATLALNWKEDSTIRIQKVIHKPLTRIVRLVFIITLSVHDIALAIYVKYYSEGDNKTGFMGHLCGALAGLLVGIFVLDNRRVRSWEPIVQWISLSIFLLMVIFAIIWNIGANTWMCDSSNPYCVYLEPDDTPLNDEKCHQTYYKNF